MHLNNFNQVWEYSRALIKKIAIIEILAGKIIKFKTIIIV